MSPVADPTGLPAALPEGLIGVEVEVIITPKVHPEEALGWAFGPDSAERFGPFWDAVCGECVESPDYEMVVMVRARTPMTDPETGQPFRRTSFLHICEGRITRFDAAEARDLLRGVEGLEADLPQASVL